jgi:putative nucleotidyltransferase with HDIG domain
MPVSQGEATLKGTVALRSIPVFPPIAIRLLQLVSSEDVALRQVIELLRADPAFSAEILRRANSSLFGTRQPVSSLQHALVVLGLRRVRSLTMTVASGMYLKAALEIAELRRCWRHTLACALLTEELARACSVHEDLAYTAGLMHDIGRLGLLVAHPVEYAKLLRSAAKRRAAEEDYDLLDHEKEVFGADHCATGNWLAEQWNLPEEFRVITGRHHDPPAGAALDLLGLVHLGCRLADALGFHVVPPRQPGSLDEIRAMLPESARRRFHTDSDDLRKFVEVRIHALDIADLPPLPAPAAGAADEPAVEAAAPEAVPPSTLRRDIIVAVVSSVLAATVFFLLMYRFAG